MTSHLQINLRVTLFFPCNCLKALNTAVDWRLSVPVGSTGLLRRAIAHRIKGVLHLIVEVVGDPDQAKGRGLAIHLFARQPAAWQEQLNLAPFFVDANGLPSLTPALMLGK